MKSSTLVASFAGPGRSTFPQAPPPAARCSSYDGVLARVGLFVDAVVSKAGLEQTMVARRMNFNGCGPWVVLGG